MSRLRVAVIGGGHLGRIHARLASSIDEIDLVGVVDPDPEARERVAAEADTTPVSDVRLLFNSIDAAVVAAPTRLHHPIAADLLQQGIHCLVEKPITSTIAEADELVEIAREQNLVLQVGQVERFNPTMDVVREELARPRYVESTRTSGYTFRSTDVGAVLDLMIHDIDLVLSLVDSEVVDVRAIGTALFGGFEDVAQARLEFDNGCVANLTASRASFVQQRQFHVFAEDGFAALDLAKHKATLVKPSEAFATGHVRFSDIDQEEMERIKGSLFTEILPKREITVEPRNAILEEQHDFLQSIREHKSPLVPGTDGRAALQVAESILDSIARHKWSVSRSAEGAMTVPHPRVLPRRKVSGQSAQRRKAG